MPLISRLFTASLLFKRKRTRKKKRAQSTKRVGGGGRAKRAKEKKRNGEFTFSQDDYSPSIFLAIRVPRTGRTSLALMTASTNTNNTGINF